MRVIEKFTVGSMKVRIFPDEDPGDPREWDNLGAMICCHPRYTLGDKHSFQHACGESLEDLAAQIVASEGPLIWLPLRLYDHSGISLSTTQTWPYDCPWDSMWVGLIYVTKAKVREEYSWKLLTRKRVAQIREYLAAEVETYNQFLTGDVYGYTVTNKKGVVVDSCWGFFGIEEVQQEARSQAEWFEKEAQEEWEATLMAA